MKTLRDVLWKDLLIEWRARSRTVALLSFAYTILLLFAFAIGPDAAALRQHAGAYLWLGLLLCSSLLLDRTMRTEFEAGAIQSLMLVPVSASGLFFGKALANTLQLWLVGAVSVPLVFIVCDASLTESVGLMVLTLGMGCLLYTSPSPRDS